MPSSAPTPLPDADRYRELIDREARHWGEAAPDPKYPQLWDDPELFGITIAPAYRHLLERAARHARVLELGCGDGDLAFDLAPLGSHVTGVDLSPERVARARAEAARRGLGDRTAFEVADLNTAEFAPAGFDCVVAHDALHHVLDLDHALSAAKRALVPGGTLIVSDFIGAGLIDRVASAAVYALAPTLQSYGTKWNLRGRLAAFLASEKAKREAVTRGKEANLHHASPFEGVSQAAIPAAVARRFDVVERFTYCAYWYHLVPKLRLPQAARRGVLRLARTFDAPLHARGWTRGCYAYLEARKR